MTDPRRCLICRRSQADPLHSSRSFGAIAKRTELRIEQHVFDPGERRQLIRRMDDRVRLVERRTERFEK
jgi:hypothetical protein